MKRLILLLTVVAVCQIVNAQKKYQMVVEKTDGTEVVINVEDIVRTYFRELKTPTEEELLIGEFPVGKWQECKADGTLYDDARDDEVHHMNIYSNGIGKYWSVSKGKEDKLSYSFDWAISASSISMKITAATNPALIGMSDTVQFSYVNGILHAGEIYYKKIN